MTLTPEGARERPDLDHPDCVTNRECELYDALMGLAAHATAYHHDYKLWTQGGVTLEPIVSKALRLGPFALQSTDRPSPDSKLEAYRKALASAVNELDTIAAFAEHNSRSAADKSDKQAWEVHARAIREVSKALAAGG